MPDKPTPPGSSAIVANDPWRKLRQYTSARIALGHAGTSLPTAPHLEFQLAHARARNAVHHVLDVANLREALMARGHEVIELHSAAANRPEYLQRPDKGRRLDAASRADLQSRTISSPAYDVAFVIGDGLSALAIEANAVAFLDVMVPALRDGGWRIAPVTIVGQARVAVGDEVGELLGAGIVVMLIGERPGLSSPDSLGIYMTYQPRTGLTDEARNCISNIRDQGLSFEMAAHKLLYLMTEARRRGLSGVNLKDEAEGLPSVTASVSKNFLTDA
ncbi:MAG: ethanolamine ammonia-lyase subunit EutC [Hyphomicrobium sp.]|nr:ethanolamine ammonia-lyase subunit EutC [Hyphomicrobium sp.]